MKNWIKRMVFGMHVAWRNMRIHPFRTILLIIGFLGISMTVLLVYSMTDIFHTYYYGNLAETYQDIDLKVTVDEGSQTRFFSITPLASSSIADVSGNIYPFFEYEALIEVSEQDRDYAHIYASSIDMLTHLSDASDLPDTALADHEVIITASYAENHDVNLGDLLTFKVGNQTKAFDIVAVIPDGKLFHGESVFIDKQASLSFFLTALDPVLATLPPTLLRNIYNVLYVNINDGVTYHDAVTAFKEISGYEHLDYIKTIDDVVVNQLVTRNTALLGGLMSFVFVAIMLVLQTTIRYYFHDRRRQSTLIHILGGHYAYGLSILGIELMIEQIIAIVFSIVLTNLSLRFGMNYLESAWTYQLSMTHIVFGIATILAIFVVMFVYYSYRNRTVSDITDMRLGGDERQLNWKMQIIVSGMSLVLFAALYIPPISHLLGHNASVIRVILSAVFLLFIAPVILYGVMIITKKYKERKRLYYHLRILSGKKGFSHYLSVSLIVSLVIFLLIFMMQHLNQRIESVVNTYDFDVIVTRMIGDEDTIYQEIAGMDSVASVNRADIYQAVEIKDQNVSINYVMSMDTQDIDTYFNFTNTDQIIPLLNAETEAAILLPISFHEIYDYQIEDTIVLTLNADHPNQTFIIAGFIEMQGLGLAFTNLYHIDNNVRTNANSMLVKASGLRSTLVNQLLDRYSNQLMIIFDFWSSYLTPYIVAMSRIKNFIIGYLSLVMVCFIMTLANHQTMIQIEREADDARMIAMGYQIKDMQKEAVIEGVVILSIVLIISILTYLLIIGQIEGLFAAFGAYEHISFQPITIPIGVGINIVLFSVMWLSRIGRQPNLKLMDYMRIY